MTYPIYFNYISLYTLNPWVFSCFFDRSQAKLHPLPLTQDAGEDVGAKDEGMVRDADAHIETEEENNVRNTQNANGNVADQQQLSECPFTGILLVGVNAKEGANGTCNSKDCGIEHHGEVWTLRRAARMSLT